MPPVALPGFLADECRRRPAELDGLDAVVLDIARACREIAVHVARGPVDGTHGGAGNTNVHDEEQQGLDVLADECLARSLPRSGRVAGLVSEERPSPVVSATAVRDGGYLVLVDPLDGSSNIDVNVTVGTLFSVLRAPHGDGPVTEADFLQPGSEQVCAGYATYGPSTMLVLSVGDGVHAFALDPDRGEFVLVRRHMRIAPDAHEYAVNGSNRRFWEPAVRRWVDECVAGRSGPLRRDYNTRWIASLVAEVHRILVRGGVFLYPRDSREPLRPGRLRLLYEAAPVAFLVEQAGGAASTGRGPLLATEPEEIHQRVPLIFGARGDVARIEEYHRERNDRPGTPLYGGRGLFRPAAG